MQPVRPGSRQPGMFVIDPHKDLIEDLLLLIPPRRAKDVVLLDLTDTESIVALNPLDASMGYSRDQAVANIMASFERVWSDFWGPRMAYFLKAVCLLLYTLNQEKVRRGRAETQYTISEEDLQDPHRFAWMEGEPLSGKAFFSHFHEEHEPDMRAWLDRVRRGR